MTEARPNIFDTTIGPQAERSWLDSKVLRRELTEDLHERALNHRVEKASKAAESFMDDMNRRAELRSGIERKSEEIRKQYVEEMRRHAEEYREKLRKKLRPDVWG